MAEVRVACQAMATRFELVLLGDDAAHLRAVGEEAIAEIQRLEAQLSFFRPTSEIGRINADAAVRAVPVAPAVFELLERAARLHGETQGAFDVTVGPLMRCWNFAGAEGTLPTAEALEEARSCVGMHLVELDRARRAVRFARPGVLLDLGAIGKGYALEQAAAILQELGVRNALLHGGTSTVHALGRPEGGDSWKVAIELPGAERAEDGDHLLSVVQLEDQALSVSAVWGRSFVADGTVYGHVLDPRIGWPAQGAVLAAVVSPSTTQTDALSTALLTLGLEEHPVVTDVRRELPVLVLGRSQDAGGFVAASRGFAVRPVARVVSVQELP